MDTHSCRRRRFTTDLECDIPDEFPDTPFPMGSRCVEYKMEPKESMSPRKGFEKMAYDPCNPLYVRPASELEVADLDLTMRRQQLTSLKRMVARRAKEEPNSGVVMEYGRRISELQEAVVDAESRRASIASSTYQEAPEVPDFRRQYSLYSNSTRHPSTDWDTEAPTAAPSPVSPLETLSSRPVSPRSSRASSEEEVEMTMLDAL